MRGDDAGGVPGDVARGGNDVHVDLVPADGRVLRNGERGRDLHDDDTRRVQRNMAWGEHNLLVDDGVRAASADWRLLPAAECRGDSVHDHDAGPVPDDRDLAGRGDDLHDDDLPAAAPDGRLLRAQREQHLGVRDHDAGRVHGDLEGRRDGVQRRHLRSAASDRRVLLAERGGGPRVHDHDA
jgi:hypothetical protein